MGKPKQRWRTKGIITLILVLVIGAGGFAWTKRAIWTTETLKFVQVEQGQITHEVPVQATFANQENLLPAPISGKVQFTGTDLQRFRRGEQVAAIQPDGIIPGGKPAPGAQAIITAQGGLFYRQTDGLETLFTAANFMNMDLGQLLAQAAHPKDAVTSVQAGEPIGKIVNNLQPSVAFIELPSLQDVVIGKYLNLLVNGQAQKVKVLRKSQNPQGVVVQFSAFLDGSVEKRKQQVFWMESPPVNGLIVPAQTLWTQDGVQGVFAMVGGVVRFRKVTVQDRDVDRVCVSGLAAGTTVVTNPRFGIEGQPASQ